MERDKGITILSEYLSENNSKIFEKNIYKISKSCEISYEDILYQCIGMILQMEKSLKTQLKDIKKGNIGWKSPIFNSVAERIEEFDLYLETPFEVTEGVTQCGKCGSWKTYSVQKQHRSSDEPMTTYSKCVVCSNQWSYSG